MSIDIAAALASSELFSGLSPDTIQTLAGKVTLVNLLGGQLLFDLGDVADCFYVVASGRLRVSVERPDGSEEVLGDAGRGETIGEMALLTGESRSATARAVRDTDLLRLDKAVFDQLVEEQPSVMMQVTRRMVTRYQAVLRTKGRPARGALATLAIIPCGADVPIAAFCERFEAALAGVRSVLRVNSQRVDAALGGGAAQTPRDHSRNSTLVAWLMDQETKYDLVLYEADAKRTAWTSRCIRQADRVLLVGADHASPDLGPIETAMRRDGADGTAVGRELVLLHREPRDVYSGTSAWLASRRVDRHHHVVLDSPSDFARLVRLLTGTATAVVLGGGGARSFAQIGVLRAMAEAGITIDMIGGTSMGAFLGAQLALGWDVPKMLQFNTRMWSEEKPLKEYTLPFVSLVAGNRFLRVTRRTYGEADIEDLGVPFFCCSSNITTGQVMVHDRGPVWRWLSASIAVPGISPPLFEKGQLLVDGAVLANLPVDAMRQRCDGILMAVDVTPIEDLRTSADYSMCPSSMTILANRMNPFAARLPVPSIFEILFRCAGLGSLQQVESAKRVCNLYLHPPTEPFSMFDWQKVSELADAGYHYAVKALSEWDRNARTAGAPA